jgi:hypothetical protein
MKGITAEGVAKIMVLQAERRGGVRVHGVDDGKAAATRKVCGFEAGGRGKDPSLQIPRRFRRICKSRLGGSWVQVVIRAVPDFSEILSQW